MDADPVLASGGEPAFPHDTTASTTQDSYDALLTYWRRWTALSYAAGSASLPAGTLIASGQWTETAGDGDAPRRVLVRGGEPLRLPHGATTYRAMLMERNNSGSQPPARPSPLYYLISAQMVGQMHGTGGDVFGGVPASDEAVAALPATTHCAGRRGEEDEECCAVCREEYVHGDALRTMPCKHGFHEACIFPWLRVSRLCPLCRFALPAQVAAETETAGTEEEEEGDDCDDGGTESDDDGEGRLTTSDSDS